MDSKRLNYTEINIEDHQGQLEIIIERYHGGKFFSKILIGEFHGGAVTTFMHLMILKGWISLSETKTKHYRL
ncbi:hypothetical protein [Ilyobacter sp.]|uniref:hypothetical protein n=1 Tax=Ilyobacter sp. TaxID=3100343 RepID=UPI003567050C